MSFDPFWIIIERVPSSFLSRISYTELNNPDRKFVTSINFFLSSILYDGNYGATKEEMSFDHQVVWWIAYRFPSATAMLSFFFLFAYDFLFLFSGLWSLLSQLAVLHTFVYMHRLYRSGRPTSPPLNDYYNLYCYCCGNIGTLLG